MPTWPSILKSLKSFASGNRLPSSTMSSPSRPVDIGKPPERGRDDPQATPIFGTPLMGTPDLRALRAQYSGSSPPPNIPLRGTPMISSRSGSPTPPCLITGDSTPIRHRGSMGGLSASARQYGTPPSGHDFTALDLDDLPDEEKAKVLRRHLVSRDERQNHSDKKSNSGSESEVKQDPEAGPSRRPSSGQDGKAPCREDSDAFPIPYHAPGADVT